MDGSKVIHGIIVGKDREPGEEAIADITGDNKVQFCGVSSIFIMY